MVIRLTLGVLIIVFQLLPRQVSAGDGEELGQCVATLTSGMLKMLSHSLSNDHPPSDISPSLKSSLNQFCQCKQQTQNKHKELTWIDRSFKNPRDFFDDDDQCALDTLAQSDYQLIFLTQLNERMMPLVQGRLQERYRSVASHMATPTSFKNHLNCVRDKVIVLCARSLSLATTYQCVDNYLSRARKIDMLERDCPSFHTQTPDGVELSDELELAGERI